MFNFSNILDSLDSAAKDTLDEPAPSATWLRSQRKGGNSSSSSSIISLKEDDSHGTGELGLSSSNAYIQRGLSGGSGATAGPGDEHALSALASEEVSATPFAKPTSRGNTGEGATKILPAETHAPTAAVVKGTAASSLSQSQPRLSDAAASSSTTESNEIERLNAECLDLEDQVGALRTEAQAAWTAYQRAQEQATAREGELLQELQVATQHAAGDKAALEDSQKALQKAQASLSAGGSAGEEMRQQWAVRETELVKEVETLRAGSAQGVESLQSDLRAAVEGADRLRLEHATLVRQSQRRQADLEKANAEMSAGLADTQKQLYQLQQHSSIVARAGSSTAAQEELETARENWKRVLADLEDERARADNLEKRLQNAEAEARCLAAAADDEKERAQVAATAHVRAMAALSEQLAAAERAQSGVANGGTVPGVATDEVRGLQGQVQNLSQQLLRKQQMVLDLQAERSTLKSRMQDAQAKAAIAERYMQSSANGNSGGSGYDDEDVAAMEGGRGGIQRRGRSAGRNGKKDDDADNVSSAIERYGVKTPARVAKAIDGIDALSLDFGRVLRSHPLVRVGFVAYLCLLHVWVFVVLAMHTHSLEDDIAQPADMVTSIGRGPP